MTAFTIGDRIEGRDDYYDCELAGIVTGVERSRGGEATALFTNELAGPFEGKPVALLAHQIERVVAR